MRHLRFLLLNTDYPAFLRQVYDRSPALRTGSFDDQMAARNSTFFGVADAYAAGLRMSGHWAMDVHMNNATMQAAWARENGAADLIPSPRLRRRFRRGFVPWLEWSRDSTWLRAVLARQIEVYHPDVVFNHDIAWAEPSVLQTLAPNSLLVGQHAAPPLPAWNYADYDLVFSSWPPTRQRFQREGVHCLPLRLAFDPRVLKKLGSPPRDLPLTFVGSLGDIHSARVRFLEAVCEGLPALSIWGPSVRGLSRSSPLRDHYRGSAFGLDMYRVLVRSQITLNHHGFAEPHANNMRLFEATGTGALLLTDSKNDLQGLYAPGLEVLTFDSADDCIETITGLTKERCSAVAHAGQRRTLADHTWEQRIDEILIAIGEML